MKKLFLLTVLMVTACLRQQSHAVVIDTVKIDDIGNPADPLTGLGSVGYSYEIAKFEVTNAQYAEFLNAVDQAGTNPHDIFNYGMSLEPFGGISFSAGRSTGEKYFPRAGFENKPVLYVTFFEAMRFVNWLNNGQAMSDTETGAYTLNGDVAVGLQPRKPGALYALPSANEWYKAAYFQSVTAGGDADNYWLYPTRSNDAPDFNAANFSYQIFGVTNVGAFNVPSYYGTYDQAGNAYEWTEAIEGAARHLRGGSLGTYADRAQSLTPFAINPDAVNPDIGFRVVIVPEPSPALLACFGFSLITLCRRADLNLKRPLLPRQRV